MLIKVKKPKQKPAHLAEKLFVILISMIYIIPTAGMAFIVGFIIAEIGFLGFYFAFLCLDIYVPSSDSVAMTGIIISTICGGIFALVCFVLGISYLWDAMN